MPTEVKGIQDETFLPTLPWQFITWNWNFVPRTGQETHTHAKKKNNQLTNQTTTTKQKEGERKEKA